MMCRRAAPPPKRPAAVWLTPAALSGEHDEAERDPEPRRGGAGGAAAARRLRVRASGGATARVAPRGGTTPARASRTCTPARPGRRDCARAAKSSSAAPREGARRRGAGPPSRALGAAAHAGTGYASVHSGGDVHGPPRGPPTPARSARLASRSGAHPSSRIGEDDEGRARAANPAARARGVRMRADLGLLVHSRWFF